MRLNKFIAQHTTHSRRGADTLILEGRVTVNGSTPQTGQDITETDLVKIDGVPIAATARAVTTIMLNKPAGYVCSKNGQGSETIYDLLPPEYHHLNSVGRLDKESSGLLLLTNDGELANQLTHPRYHKVKVYEVKLSQPLQPLHQQMISDYGISLEDGVSKLQLEKLDDTGRNVRVTMHEGRNRQIRRTFEALGYRVAKLHRTTFGSYQLHNLKLADFTVIND